MAKDAKIGSLIGLVLIFIIAFVINGFTRSGKTPNNSESGAVTPDNAPDIDIPERDVSGLPIRSVTKWVENTPPVEHKRDTGIYPSLSPTTPAVQELISELNTDVPKFEPDMASLPEVLYAVCEGDNLADIAKKFYGPEEGNKRANVLRIFLANRKALKSPDEILVGQKLVIPPLNSLIPDESLFSHPMFEKVSSIGRTHLSTDNHTAKQNRLYAVQEGDSLWSISSTLLGDGRRYKEISKLNSSLLRDEDHLVVGMQLRIPAQ